VVLERPAGAVTRQEIADAYFGVGP
jgi:hypothetical protein